MGIGDRLSQHFVLLALIDQRRSKSGDHALGSAIEEQIVWRELRELEKEIARDPGALAGFVAKAPA